MALIKISSPHAHMPGNAGNVMQQVLLAAIPGIAALWYFFGWGVLVNITWAVTVALGCEAAMLKLRRRPIGFYLKDYSAVVTAVLLAIAMPPYSSWWLILIGTSSAIIIAKHLYGGMGYNPFNPAMVGYVLLLIAFPLEMSQWAAPAGMLADQAAMPGLMDSILACFGFLGQPTVDAVTMATPLDIVRLNDSLMLNVLEEQNPQFGRWGGHGWEWANIAFLLGGLYLLSRRIFTWHAPVGMLFTIALLSVIFYDDGSSASAGTPLMHLLSGATMLGAFFIVTDPVTSATSVRGRLIYGILIGLLVFIIRVWGNYPDAVAFAVLLMNFAAPFLDHYTQPRVYGHSKSGGKQ